MDLDFKRSLYNSDFEMDYQRRAHHHKKRDRFHHGQRKLLMSEIEFLTRAMSEKSNHKHRTTVLYVGAAPGTHIIYLTVLFPDIHFILFDANPFFPKLYQVPNICIKSMFFDTHIAEEYALIYRNNDLLFISDIRSTTNENPQCEYLVQQDMKAQMQWHLIMQPRLSMLKFRLPYIPLGSVYHDQDYTEYLEGDMKLPVWGSLSTTECRLIVPCLANITRYNHKVHESKMYYFNTQVRYRYYPLPHSARELECVYCNYYDDAAEVWILARYIELILRRYHDIHGIILDMHYDITRLLNRPWIN